MCPIPLRSYFSRMRSERLWYDCVEGGGYVCMVFEGEVVSFPDIMPHKNVCWG